MKSVENDPVSIVMRLGGNEIRFKLPLWEYRELQQKVSGAINDAASWLSINGQDGAELWFCRTSVVAMEMRPPGVRSVSRRAGVTKKEIAKVTGQAYVTLVRKIKKKGGIQLDVASDRRVLLTSENIKTLNLTDDHVEKLKAIERARCGE